LVCRASPTSTLFPYTTLFRSLISLIAEQLGSKIPSRQLQKWQLQLLWRLDAVRAFIFHQNRLLTRNTAESLWSESQYSSLKIIRSEEHTSELQSRENLVCRLL